MSEKLKILYIDDERALLDIGKLFLEDTGPFDVDTCISALSALNILESTTYDAIISDYHMPKMDGIELLKKVRSSGNTIPFILFTGRGREEVVIQALNEGADFYLQKGGSPEPLFVELSHKIRQAVQQRRAEANIRDLERRQAEIINFLPDATFAIDANGVVIAWNRAMEDFSGIVSSEILGKGDQHYALSIYHQRRPLLVDLILKDDPETEAKYPYVLRSGRKLFSEMYFPERNHGAGALVWIVASPVYDSKGRIVGAIESIRDISERKNAEEAIRDSAERYKSIITLSNTGAWEYDSDQKNFWYSPECLSILGRDTDQYKPSDSIRIKELLLNLIHPEDRARAFEDFSRYISSGSPGIFETFFRMQHAHGHWLWIRCRGWTLRRDDETLTGRTIGTLIDITESHRAEEKQKVYTQHLCLAQEIGQIGSWELFLDTGMIWGSEEAFRLSGIRRPPDGMTTPQNLESRMSERERVHQALLDLITTGAPFDVTYSINPDGGSGPRIMHSVARLLYNAEGVPFRVAGVIQDITQRICIEEELKRGRNPS